MAAIWRVSKALICDARIEAGQAATAIAHSEATGRRPRIVVPAALWHSGEAKIAACSLRSATVPTGAALRLVAAPRIFVRPSSLLHCCRATSTRQGFDTAIGMRRISSRDALVIEIQNPSRLPSYAISCARAASRQGVFVRREFHSVIVVVGTSVANHLKRIPHVGPPLPHSALAIGSGHLRQLQISRQRRPDEHGFLSARSDRRP